MPSLDMCGHDMYYPTDYPTDGVYISSAGGVMKYIRRAGRSAWNGATMAQNKMVDTIFIEYNRLDLVLNHSAGDLTILIAALDSFIVKVVNLQTLYLSLNGTPVQWIEQASAQSVTAREYGAEMSAINALRGAYVSFKTSALPQIRNSSIMIGLTESLIQAAVTLHSAYLANDKTHAKWMRVYTHRTYNPQIESPPPPPPSGQDVYSSPSSHGGYPDYSPTGTASCYGWHPAYPPPGLAAYYYQGY